MRQGIRFASFRRAEGMIRAEGGRGAGGGEGGGREKGMEAKGTGMRSVRRRQYLRVRRPANIHACVSRNVASRTVHQERIA